MKIIETKKRSVLSEGRNNGMGYALLEKKSKDEYETVQPLSPCKDYLNEVVFTENTGIPSSAYGLHYPEKKEIFKDRVYMAIKILPTSGNSYSYNASRSLQEDRDKVNTNYKNIQLLINRIERQMGITGRTTLTLADNDQVLVSAPLDWRKSTVTISLLSLLLRVGIVYDGKQEAFAFLESYNYNNQDKGMVNNAIPKMKKFIEEKTLPEQPTFNEEYAKKGQWTPHNVGIMSYIIPAKK